MEEYVIRSVAVHPPQWRCGRCIHSLDVLPERDSPSYHQMTDVFIYLDSKCLWLSTVCTHYLNCYGN